MEPRNALRDDWPLYYNETLMRDITREENEGGIVRVVGVPGNNEDAFFCSTPTGERDIPHTQLVPWWPRVGAYTYGERSGIFLYRGAVRTAKRSAYTQYKSNYGNFFSTYPKLLMGLREEYFTYQDALDRVKHRISVPVALANDLLLVPMVRGMAPDITVWEVYGMSGRVGHIDSDSEINMKFLLSYGLPDHYAQMYIKKLKGVGYDGT